MSARHRVLPALLLTLALAAGAPLGAGAPDAAAAKDYAYPLVFEDPAGDQAAPGAGAPAAATVPETDILKLEMTDDADGVIARITLATLEFAAPQGTVRLSLMLKGPAGEEWEATVTYGSGGADLTAGQDFGPASGDPDEPVPGMRAEADAEVNAIYMFFDNADTDGAVGSVLELDNVNTGRGAALFAFNGQDQLDLGQDYTLALAATGGPAGGSGAPLRVFKTFNGTRLNESFATPTNATVQYNLTYDGDAGRVDLAVAGNGTVRALVLDAANATVANLTLESSGNRTANFTGAAPGFWTVRLNLTAFAGNLTLEIVAPPPNATTTTSSEPNDDTRTGTFPLREDKDTPGPGVPLLLVAAALASVLVRRRLR